jgi:membrane-bound serine protease (ClpP class)
MTVPNRLAGRFMAAILAGALALWVSGPGTGRPSPAMPPTAAIVALDGAIDPASATYVVRSLSLAQRLRASVIVLRLDTPGGLDTAMRDIIRAMLASPVPVIAYVAPSGARAASAGTYILYASALAAMAPGTNLGAATPVSLFGGTALPPPEGKPAAGARNRGQPAAGGLETDAMAAKVTNDAVAYIRSLAAMHNRNADWAEQAVRQAVSLPYDAALAQHVIDLVAPTLADLLAQADGHVVVVGNSPMRLATRGLQVVTLKPGWRDRLLSTISDPQVVYLLLLAGLAAIGIELTHPGLIAPGVIGSICLLVGGYGLDLLPINYAGVALTLLGIGLMTAEAFIPAFGALVLGGATAFAIGSVMMFEDPGFRPSLPVIAGATLTIAALCGIVLSLLIRARRRPLATGPAALFGLAGRVIRWTGCEGEVLVQGEHWRARAEHPLMPGEAVQVIGRQGLVLLVEHAGEGRA